MDEFLRVINGIDWDQLHRQKYEILKVIEDHEKLLGEYKGELMGIVHLLDDLQDVADNLRIWEFPGEYDGECPECNERNYVHLEKEKYECFDCGLLFTPKEQTVK